MTDFETKDSGERAHFESGMQRDTQAGKARFDLTIPLGVPYDEQLLTRFAKLMGRGADKYTERNWEQASGDEELARFKASAFRHFMQWYCGERDEDHAAAVMFNMMGFETTEYKMSATTEAEPTADGMMLSGTIVGNEICFGLDDPADKDAAQESINAAFNRLERGGYTPPTLTM